MTRPVTSTCFVNLVQTLLPWGPLHWGVVCDCTSSACHNHWTMHESSSHSLQWRYSSVRHSGGGQGGVPIGYISMLSRPLIDNWKSLIISLTHGLESVASQARAWSSYSTLLLIPKLQPDFFISFILSNSIITNRQTDEQTVAQT